MSRLKFLLLSSYTWNGNLSTEDTEQLISRLFYLGLRAGIVIGFSVGVTLALLTFLFIL